MESIAVESGNAIMLKDDTLQNSHNSEISKISRNNSPRTIYRTSSTISTVIQVSMLCPSSLSLLAPVKQYSLFTRESISWPSRTRSSRFSLTLAEVREKGISKGAGGSEGRSTARRAGSS